MASVSIFRQPKGYLKLIEITLSLIAFIVVIIFEPKVKVYDATNSTDASEHFFRLRAPYPFRYGHAVVSNDSSSTIDIPLRLTVVRVDVEAGAKVYVAMQWISVTIGVVLLVVYGIFSSDTAKRRMSIWDTFFNSVVGFSLLAVSISWTIQLPRMDNDIRGSLTSFFQKMPDLRDSCPSFDGKVCGAKWPTYGTAIASLFFSYLCSLVWLVNTWLVFRNSYLHKPQLYEPFAASRGDARRRGNLEVPGEDTISPEGSYHRSRPALSPGLQMEERS
eukprot:m.2225 g.2225  ORF g.2225 m.2225 type:complete len:275 (+) comp8471_c0_seq1:439-1263(+)